MNTKLNLNKDYDFLANLVSKYNFLLYNWFAKAQKGNDFFQSLQTGSNSTYIQNIKLKYVKVGGNLNIAIRDSL